MSEALLQRAQGRYICQGCVTGDELLFALEVADDGFEVGILGDDMEVAVRVSGEKSSEFQSQNHVERVAAIDGSLDDP